MLNCVCFGSAEFPASFLLVFALDGLGILSKPSRQQRCLQEVLSLQLWLQAHLPLASCRGSCVTVSFSCSLDVLCFFFFGALTFGLASSSKSSMFPKPPF